MILSDKKKEKLKIEGAWFQVLAELSIVIEELAKDIDEDKIIFSVKLGLCGGDTLKMLDLAKEEIKRGKEKEKNERNTKENNI